MATVTAYTALNMATLGGWNGIVSGGSSSIIVRSQSRFGHYSGSSFGYANDGTVISGTMTGYSQTLGVLPSYE